MNITSRLAKNLRLLRQQKGWSQEELAFESGLHRTYISDLERAARNPSIAIIDRLAKCFKVQPGKLLDADIRQRSG